MTHLKFMILSWLFTMRGIEKMIFPWSIIFATFWKKDLKFKFCRFLFPILLCIFQRQIFLQTSVMVFIGRKISKSMSGQAYDNKKNHKPEYWNIIYKSSTSNFGRVSSLGHNYLDITFDIKTGIDLNRNSIKCSYLSSPYIREM